MDDKKMKYLEAWRTTKEMLGRPLTLLLEGEGCTDRKGILQQRHNGEWVNIALEDVMTGEPRVFACEHHALDAVREVMTINAMLAKAGKKEWGDLPSPDDFRYTFVDEAPEDVEVDVDNVDQASSVISSLMKGATK